jgi:hypothetical protein
LLPGIPGPVMKEVWRIYYLLFLRAGMIFASLAPNTMKIQYVCLNPDVELNRTEIKAV